MSIFDREKLKTGNDSLARLNYIESVLATRGFDVNPSNYFYVYKKHKYMFSVNEFRGSAEYDESEDPIVIFFECLPDTENDIVDVSGKIMVNVWNATDETFNKIDAMLDRIKLRNDVLKVIDSFVIKDAYLLSEEVKREIEVFENKLLSLLF